MTTLNNQQQSNNSTPFPPPIIITTTSPPPPDEHESQSPVNISLTPASPINHHNNTHQSSWQPLHSPITTQSQTIDFNNYFSNRIELTDIVNELKIFIVEGMDGEMVDYWLLTEITPPWNLQKERLLVLCQKTILIIKYDFIIMKIQEVRRIQLIIIDKIVQGELKYPDRSLTPHIDGIKSGVTTIFKNYLIPNIQHGIQFLSHKLIRKEVVYEESCEQSFKDLVRLDNFMARPLNNLGLRLIWSNSTIPPTPPPTPSWNPLPTTTTTTPTITLISHPLLHKPDSENNNKYDINIFTQKLINQLNICLNTTQSPICRIEYKSIVINSWIGLPSLVLNESEVGFNKVRGGGVCF